MLLLKILVGKLLAVDGLASRAITCRKVTALDHELLDDAVEQTALIVQRLARLADALLARAEGPEVLGSLWHDVIVQFKRDAPSRFAPNGDIEEGVGPRLLLTGVL